MSGSFNGSDELLKLVLGAAQEMSRHDDPAEVTRIALSWGRKILHFDRSMAATRRDLTPPLIRVTRSDAPGTDFHDPAGYGRTPAIRGGILSALLYAGKPRVIDDLIFSPDDPATSFLLGMKSLAAIPLFVGGEAVEMVFHLGRERAAFSHDKFAERVLISSLFGQSLHNLVRARELTETEHAIREQYETIAKISTDVMNSALDLKHDNEILELRVRHRTAELSEANLDAIYMLAIASEAKDVDTGAHVKRIAVQTRTIAKELGMGDREAERLGHSAILHDVGKIHVPDQILKKPGPLTPEEWVQMREHTVAGEHILSDKPFFSAARRIARNHHENFDGSGYPDAKRGEDIPIEARIVHLVDVYDALTNPRVYKSAWGHKEAADFIRDEAGLMFDPELVKAFQSVARGNENTINENDTTETRTSDTRTSETGKNA